VSKVILIQDDMHAELQKTEYASFQQAVEELKRRAAIPWNEPPNRCPCLGGTCGRAYALREFERAEPPPWKSLRKAIVVKVNRAGVVWNPDYERDWTAGDGA
jgi:hypothetical protein